MDAGRPSSDRPFLDSCRVDLVPPQLEMHEWQRAARWTGYRTARSQVEVALVAGAVDHALLHQRSHGAGEMRASLTVRDELAFLRAHHDTVVLLAGIAEGQHAASGHLVQRGHSPNLGRAAAPAPPVLYANPELANRQRQAREHHELHELA